MLLARVVAYQEVLAFHPSRVSRRLIFEEHEFTGIPQFTIKIEVQYNPDYRFADGKTILHTLSASSESPQILRLLLDNLANPNPSANVTFGEKTTDEMMVGFIHYSYVDKEQQADMPTMSVPPHLRQQMEAVRKMREQQRKADK